MTMVKDGQEILVTGGSGFIGRSLVRALAGNGARVRVLARSPEKAERLFSSCGDNGPGGHVEVCEGDLLSAESVARACTGVETIYHVGGLYKFGPRHARTMWRTNVEGAENVFAAAWKARVEKIVHVSSAGVLCNRNRGPLTERDFPSRAPRFSPYKASKWEAERRALDWAKRGLPLVIACPPCPVGAGDEAPTPTGRMVLDFVTGRFPFSARTGLNFIGVDDLAEGLIAVAARGRTGERYVLGHENLWLDEFLALLADITGQPAPRVRLPWVVIALAGALGEAGAQLGFSRSTDTDPKDASRECRVCLETALKARCLQFFELDKARWELGWEARRPLRESLVEAVAWFRARSSQPSPRRVAHARDDEEDAASAVAAASDMAAGSGAEIHGA